MYCEKYLSFLWSVQRNQKCSFDKIYTTAGTTIYTIECQEILLGPDTCAVAGRGKWTRCQRWLAEKGGADNQEGAKATQHFEGSISENMLRGQGNRNILMGSMSGNILRGQGHETFRGVKITKHFEGSRSEKCYGSRFEILRDYKERNIPK